MLPATRGMGVPRHCMRAPLSFLLAASGAKIIYALFLGPMFADMRHLAHHLSQIFVCAYYYPGGRCRFRRSAPEPGAGDYNWGRPQLGGRWSKARLRRRRGRRMTAARVRTPAASWISVPQLQAPITRRQSSEKYQTWNLIDLSQDDVV